MADSEVYSAAVFGAPQQQAPQRLGGAARIAAIVLCVIAVLLVLLLLVQVGCHFSSVPETGCGGNKGGAQRGQRAQMAAHAAGPAAAGGEAHADIFVPFTPAAAKPGAAKPCKITQEADINTAAASAPTVLMLYADWCGACKVTLPQVAEATPSSSFTVLGIEATHITPALAKRVGLTAFPTFAKLSKGGTVTERMMGGGESRVREFLGCGGGGKTAGGGQG